MRGARNRFLAWGTLAIALAATTACLQAAEFAARVDASTGELVLSHPASEAGELECRIVTPGLAKFETGADVGEAGIIYLPPREGPIRLDRKNDTSGAETYFVFHSLAAGEGWELVARFAANDGVARTWKLNGRFSPLGGSLADEIAIPVGALEPGENLLYVSPPPRERPSFFYRRRAATNPASGATASNERVSLLNASVWQGEVSWWRRDANTTWRDVAKRTIAAREPARRNVAVPEEWWRDRARVWAAAAATGNNALAARVRKPGSLLEDGFHLVYDPQKESHRMSHWLWSWGPTITLLLKLHAAAPDAATAPAWREAAIAAGRRSLAFGMRDPAHPAAGVSTVRWEPSRAVPGGWVEYLSTADSLFLAGWGWMPLYRLTGERVFLERTQTLVDAAQRLMAAYPVVPQDWVVQRERWTPHTLDESVFGMIGFRELHRATGSAEIAAAGRRFLDSHLEHMGREDGLLERAWIREDDKAIWDPDIKGHAWVVEGYLDAHALTGERRYLELARQLTDRVLACQAEDGAWTYLFKRPGPNDPRDDKGTAIWAYMLYVLYKTSGDERHLAAARRAVAWCWRQQYRGEHPGLDGGILNVNSMAYVQRRPMTILYSTTFFGLALLEELALAAK